MQKERYNRKSVSTQKSLTPGAKNPSQSKLIEIYWLLREAFRDLKILSSSDIKLFELVRI